MKTQDLVLLPLTIYGTPSGNYDGSSDTDFAGDRQKGVGYYRRASGTQSVMFDVNDFIGEIEIQGSLDDDPTIDADWFDIYTFPDDSAATSATVSVALTGNFAWLRAKVTGFLGGTINSVTLTY